VKLTAIIAEAEAPAKEQPQVPFFANPLFLVLMFGLFFLVVMLPAQRRQKRAAAALLAALKQGSRIVTTGGILGTIVRIKDGEAEDARIKILRSTVARVLGEDTDAKS
jgi:preprotein translocase subunit YajC